MKIRVSRKRWLRGVENSALLSSNKKMCCLGFGARQCGVKARDILNKLMPGSIRPDHRTQALLDSPLLTTIEFSPGSCYNSLLSEGAAVINDDPKLTDRERETQLRSLFRKHGHQIVFVP